MLAIFARCWLDAEFILLSAAELHPNPTVEKYQDSYHQCGRVVIPGMRIVRKLEEGTLMIQRKLGWCSSFYEITRLS